jgi:hypothetical protein
MADLYSVLPGIQVSSDEIMEGELLATQILQAKFPDLDLREGTGARDLVIRPLGTGLAMLNKALLFYFVQNTISGVNDDTPAEIVDKILSNWFLTRIQGTQSIVNARLFFARQKDIVVPVDAFFSTDNALKFFPQQTTSVASSQLIFDAFSNEYYFDVDLLAEQVGTDYNISSGSLLYFSSFDPYFLHAEINFLKQQASASETNTEFINRSSTAISTRNLINVPSIASNLLAKFSLISGVTSVGMGDPEMIRDQVDAYVSTLTPPHVPIHVGGMMDIYVRVPLASGIVQLTADSNGKIQLGGAIYSFSRSQTSGSAVADTILYYITKAVTSITRSTTTATVTTTASHGFTTGDSITIIGASPAGYNGTFTITSTGSNTFTYPVVNTLTTPATGTITANKQTPFTKSNFYASTQTLTSLTSSLNVATATLNSHGFSAGRYITIAGATPAGYNGTFLITSATLNTFTYAIVGPLSTPATGTITVTGTVPGTDYGFSDRAIQIADFGGGSANGTASFNINYFQDIDGLQNYLEDQEQRVLCADPLARGYNVYLLDVVITAYNGPAPDPDIATAVTKDYLSTLQGGEMFVMGDLIAALNASEIKTIKTPLTITYNYYNRDLITPITGTITDFLDPNDRTAIFMLNSLTTNNQTI